MINFSDVFIFSDIPTTCPYCLRRSELIADFSHTLKRTEIHKCLYEDCDFDEFILEWDEEFS